MPADTDRRVCGDKLTFMGLLESLFYMMWRGLAIGILISAPMGPVGILCIQRTLDKGRRAGLYTGVGAAISDLFYCLLTGFGLSFIENFLERNQNIIQLVGSAVLIVFAVYLFRKNPASSLRKRSEPEVSARTNILYGFSFTVSNPLILFLIIGLFARFNFAMPDIRFYHYIVGFVFILLGALAWWWMVTFFIDKVRSHFNLRSMWLINKIIGGIIMIFAIVGVITGVMALASPAEARTVYMNASRGYGKSAYATPEGIAIERLSTEPAGDTLTLDPASSAFTLEFRIRNLHNTPGKRYAYTLPDGRRGNATAPPWTLTATDTGGASIIMEVSASEGGFDGISSQATLSFRVISTDGILAATTVTKGLDMHRGTNRYVLRRDGSSWRLSGGDRQENAIMEWNYDGAPSREVLFAPEPGGSILISDIILESRRFAAESPVVHTNEELTAHFKQSKDRMEGYWSVFDRSIDEELLKLGGDYRLALVASGDGGYDVLYIDGARVNRKSWKPGMKKAELYPTPFPGIYDVTWYDAEGEPLSHDIKAQLDTPRTLSIQFPYHNTTLRLGKN